jgi:hypothetical protein
MTRKRQLWISGIGLLLAAVAIWVRDRQWLAAPEDSLPLAFGLPRLVDRVVLQKKL